MQNTIGSLILLLNDFSKKCKIKDIKITSNDLCIEVTDSKIPNQTVRPTNVRRNVSKQQKQRKKEMRQLNRNKKRKEASTSKQLLNLQNKVA